MTRHPDRAPPARHKPDKAADGMKQPGHSDSCRASSTYRPPDYVIVVAASDWVKEHFPAAGANLWDALHTGEDRHRDPEPGLEAEP